MVHGGARQRGGRLAEVCWLRDRYARRAECAVGEIDQCSFRGKPDVAERAGDGRGAWRGRTTRPRLAGRQYASRVAARRHAAARSADEGDRWLAEGCECVRWDSVWGHERNCALRRNPRGDEWAARCLGTKAEQGRGGRNDVGLPATEPVPTW